jgi:DNA ligase (NAD+)
MDKTDYELLVAEITKHDLHYYTLDEQLVSDSEYDKMYQTLVDAESEHPDWVTETSPTQRVGGRMLDKFEKKQHTTALYSLQKAQYVKDCEKILSDILKALGSAFYNFSLEQKMDGLAVVVRYENGKLTEARTRGNGKIGEIVTEQIKTIRSVPLQIKELQTLEFQGEVYMPISKFNAYNKKAAEPLKNVRNGAAGAVRNLNPKITAERPLDIFFYNVSFAEAELFQTQEEMMDFIKNQGLKTNPYFKTFSKIEELINFIKEMEIKRPSLDWEIDGLVVKINQVPLREKLGYTSKFPKWAFAYKFESVEETTVLLSVVWQVGRTGKITPIGMLDAIDIGGVTVSKATLNNVDDIERKGVSTGCEVFVRRSNDVIPEITAVVEGSFGEVITIPTQCPDCKTNLIEVGAHLYCPNTKDCFAQIVGRMVHFASRDAMNIDTFSEKTAEQLVKAGLATTILDLYELKLTDLLKLERFGEKKAQNLLDAIEKSKKQPLASFLYGLGIRHTGKGTVERLLRYYPTIEAIGSATMEELAQIEDVGEVVAKSIFEFFRDAEQLSILNVLKEKGLATEKVQMSLDEIHPNFAQKVFVITGTMPSGDPRSKIETLIKSKGGVISGSVGKKTDFVVVGEDAGSKADKAEQLKIKILSEEALYQLAK